MSKKESKDKKIIVALKEFPGKIIQQLPLIKKEGMKPMTSAELMEKTLEALVHPEEESIFGTKSIDAATGVFQHPDGNIKIVNNLKLILELAKESNLSYGAMQLRKGKYASICYFNDQLKGYEFSRDDVLRYGNKMQAQKDAMVNPLLIAFADGNKHLAREYVQAAYALFKDESADEQPLKKMMGLYFSGVQEIVTARLVNLGAARDNFDLVSYHSMNRDNGLLVGIPKKAKKKTKNNKGK